MHPHITEEVLQQSLTFDAYLNLFHQILEEKIPRTGPYFQDSTFRYTGSNLRRTKQVMEFMTIQQKLYNILSEWKEPVYWVVLTEPWCGDASWGTTALYMLSTAAPEIDFRILLRDSHLNVMQQYQTNGGNAIPKLVCIRKKDGKELGTWGPRPKALQDMVMALKDEPGFDYKESVRKIHAWYEQDMTNAIQDEITVLLKQWITQQ